MERSVNNGLVAVASVLHVSGDVDLAIAPSLRVNVMAEPERRVRGRDRPGSHTSSQVSEAILGPFLLHDFFLHYVSRFGYRPSRVVFLAEHAWSDRGAGAWPEDVADSDRHEYDRETINTGSRSSSSGSSKPVNSTIGAAECTEGRLRWLAVATQ